MLRCSSVTRLKCVSSYSFRRTQPLSLRIWHWLNAFAILGLLGTVFLRKTFLNWRTNSALIEEKLRDAGTTVAPEVAKDIATSMRAPMWNWHIYLGFLLGALVVARVVIGLVGGVPTPAAEALRAFKDKSGEGRRKAVHFALAKTAHALFYLAAAFMVVTGAVLYFKTGLGVSKTVVGTIKELHELMVFVFVAFVVAHVAGIVLKENRDEPGLVSDMIHGAPKGS